MTISSQPLLVARDRLALSDKVTAYISQARRVTADGITFGELVELIVAAMRLAIAAVDELGLAGEQKKAIVVDLAATLFDEFADLAVPLPLKPIWWMVKPAARALCQTLAAGAVEALIPLVRIADE